MKRYAVRAVWWVFCNVRLYGLAPTVSNWLMNQSNCERTDNG